MLHALPLLWPCGYRPFPDDDAPLTWRTASARVAHSHAHSPSGPVPWRLSWLGKMHTPCGAADRFFCGRCRQVAPTAGRVKRPPQSASSSHAAARSAANFQQRTCAIYFSAPVPKGSRMNASGWLSAHLTFLTRTVGLSAHAPVRPYPQCACPKEWPPSMWHSHECTFYPLGPLLVRVERLATSCCSVRAVST